MTHTSAIFDLPFLADIIKKFHSPGTGNGDRECSLKITKTNNVQVSLAYFFSTQKALKHCN